MSKNLPEIRIQYAWLLALNASKGLNELWGDGSPLYDYEYYEKIAKSYAKEWTKYEDKILPEICKKVHLNFRLNIIDVYIAPWFGAFSDPLVIGVMNSPDRFVDVLTHELIHKLLTDNTSVPFSFDLTKEWTKLFGTHKFDTLVHIPVHAILKSIFIDHLKAPERLRRDIASYKEVDALAYIDAWEYVEINGYKTIIEKLSQSYARIASQQN